MKQSIWCQQHERWHDVTDSERAVVRERATHLHILECFVTHEHGEILECVVCGEQWGAA
ncbi:MAG: hypothetical protein ACSLFQ_00130 [Thermoanaerobaculia bacterium]